MVPRGGCVCGGARRRPGLVLRNGERALKPRIGKDRRTAALVPEGKTSTMGDDENSPKAYSCMFNGVYMDLFETTNAANAKFLAE